MPVDMESMPRTERERAANAIGARPRASWRETVSTGLFYSGMTQLIRILSRHYTLSSGVGGAEKRWKRTPGARFAILCYHRIGTGGIPLFSNLPSQVFEDEMRFLRRRYRILSLNEMCDELENPTTGEQGIVVTFDDGYRDLYEHAFPVLQKYEIPATVFLPVTSIESGEVPWYDRIFLALSILPAEQFEIELEGRRSFTLSSQKARIEAAAEIIGWLRTIPDGRRREVCASLESGVPLPQDQLSNRMLTWEQIRKMSARGVLFGSHTMTHATVSRLTSEERRYELLDSKRLLEERIGEPVSHFAFPFGKTADCGYEALQELRQYGYRSAVTTTPGTNAPGDSLYELRRVSLGEEQHLPMFAFKICQLFLTAGAAGPQAAPVSTESRSEAAYHPGGFST